MSSHISSWRESTQNRMQQFDRVHIACTVFLGEREGEEVGNSLRQTNMRMW